MKSSLNGPAPEKSRIRRVLMLVENSAYSEDGRVRCEANSLTTAGYKVTVIGQKPAAERWHENFEGVSAYQFPEPLAANGMLGYVLEYAYTLPAMWLLSMWIALRHGFDVVHAHNPPDFLVLIGGFWKLFGKRLVFDEHDLSPDMYLTRFAGSGNRLLHRVLLFFERMSCRLSDQVIATNESGKRTLVARSGVPASRVTVVRNGPEPWHLFHHGVDPSLRGDAAIVLGYVGMMGQQDGIDYLLRALQVVRHVHGRTDWKCVLIGKGPALESLRQLASELGIAENVHFTGWVDYEQVPKYLAAADICVVPDPANDYNNRSTIVKVMEYMAQAKPVVAFDLPEHRVTAGDTALYAQANDEREFAERILQLMDNPELRARLGEAGQRRVKEQLTWERQERFLLAVYEKLDGHVETRQEERMESRAMVAAS